MKFFIGINGYGANFTFTERTDWGEKSKEINRIMSKAIGEGVKC
jgi:hypothetical protein